MITTAILIKRFTSDGLMEMWEHVAIGKVYLVDLATIRMAQFYNIDQKSFHMKEIITVVDESREPLGWFPVECLEIL